MSGNPYSPGLSPKTRPSSTRRRSTSSSGAATSYFVIRRSSKKTTSNDTSGIELNTSIGSNRPTSPWPSFPQTPTGYFSTPTNINRSLLDWNTAGSRGSNSGDPPRSPRDGFEWVWLPAGYWAEREVPPSKLKGSPTRSRWFNQSEGASGKDASNSPQEKRSRTGPGGSGESSLDQGSTEKKYRSSSVRSSSTSSSCNSLSRNTIFSKNASEKAHLSGLKKLSYLSVTYPHFVSPEGEPEGLYCKTRRNLGLGGKQAELLETSSVMSNMSNTGLILAGASYFLKKAKRQKTGDSDEVHRPTKIGMAPWHRSDSIDSGLSASSSVRDVVRGKTPPATPVPSAKYYGHNIKEFMKFDISDPLNPGFLPSEAQRIQTPVEEPAIWRPSRGYFFEHNAQHEAPNEQSQNRQSRKQPSGEEDKRSIPSHVYRPSPLGKAHCEAANYRDDGKQVHSAQKSQNKDLDRVGSLRKRLSTFEISVPEHLPSSPLCPMNPKHSSGGTGICPFHGRSRTDSP